MSLTTNYVESQVGDDALQNRARVILTPETLAKAAGGKPKKRMSNYVTRVGRMQRDKIKQYIRDKPYGQQLSIYDVARVIDARGSNVYATLKRMVRDGEIYKHEITPFNYFYTVADEVKVTKLPDRPPLTKNYSSHQKIRDYLASLPRGTIVTGMEVADATGLFSGKQRDVSACSALRAMERKGMIITHGTSRVRKWYEVPGVHDVPEPTPDKPADVQVTAEEITASFPEPPPQTPPQFAPSALVLPLAKDYAWENPEDAPTIKRFFDWVQGDTDDRA